MKTQLNSTQPWGIYRRAGSCVLCADGKIRSLAYLARTADTFFSVPAAIRVRGEYVTGYVTSEATKGRGAPDAKAMIFRMHARHAGKMTDWPKWPEIGPFVSEKTGDAYANGFDAWKAECEKADAAHDALILSAQ